MTQNNQSSVLDEPFNIEEQSFIGVAADTICSPASPDVKATRISEDLATVAQADTIAARTIAIPTSAEIIVRSRGRRGNRRRATRRDGQCKFLCAELLASWDNAIARPVASSKSSELTLHIATHETKA